MNTTTINPFLNRNKVTDTKEFFGRKKEIDYIINKLTYPEPQSVAIIGERRSGKSSLLTHIYYLLSKNKNKTIKDSDKFVCILLDLEEITTDSADDFTWVVIDEIVSENQSLLNYVRYYPAGTAENNMPKRRPQIILKNLLKNACADGYRFVFLVDEFELLARNPKLKQAKYLHYLRGISDNYALAFITSSRRPLNEISSEVDYHGSPFDNNFSQPLLLGLLSIQGSGDLIQGILKNHGYEATTFQNTEVEKVINLAGRHPYYLKIACSHLFEWVNDGRPENVSWEEGFKSEANEEFHRMWVALNEEERDLTLSARNPGNIRKDESTINKTLLSLYHRGLLISTEDKKSLVLFSEGFAKFIHEYVKALENDYEEIERYICGGYLKFNIDDLKSTLAHLNRLKNEWKRQEKKSIPFEKTSYIKCDRLTILINHILELFELTKALEGGQSTTSVDKMVNHRKVEAVLSNICECFEKPDWFLEDCSESINVKAGKNFLDQLVNYLKQLEKHNIFGNGYDRVLSIRINFMKKYGWEKFPEFSEEITDAINRLTEVHDYSRASELLQLKQNKFVSWISKIFFQHPLETLAANIIIPLMLCNILDSSLRGKHDMIRYLIWGVVLFGFYSHYMWAMHKHLLSERFCNLPNSRKLYKKLLFYRTYGVTILVFSGFLWYLFNTPEHIKTIFKKQYQILGIVFVLGLLSWLLIAKFIKPKVLDFSVAQRRASYFFSVEYFKSFWIVIMIYLLFGFLAKGTEFSNVMLTLAKEGDPKWYLLDKAEIFGIIFSFPIILAASFLGPISGAWKFLKERFT